MNASETIELLARSQGHYLTPARTSGDLKQDVPRLLIWDASGAGHRRSWRVAGDGYIGHDNESRMMPLCSFLQTQVLPIVRQEADISGHFNIELHDSYTYLGRHPREYYDNCMTFSKFSDHMRAVVVPDMYQLQGYSPISPDPYTWAQKQPKVVGAYTTTGERDPTKNERIQICLKALDYPGACDLRVTKIAQMSRNAFMAASPRAASILSDFAPPAEQLKNQCVLSVKGNTACWDVAWLLSSNSIMLQKYHNEICWYSPMMLDGTHYRRCHTFEQVLSQASYYNSNPNEATHMARCANKFVRDFMLPQSRTVQYWKHLLEEMSQNRP